MTLKELRISKGMSQVQCAKYLGMTTRNYQNYENNTNKVGSAKYNAIYQKLEAYGQSAPALISTKTIEEFRTNVITGAALTAFATTVAKYGKRDCFEKLQKFVEGSYDVFYMA